MRIKFFVLYLLFAVPLTADDGANNRNILTVVGQGKATAETSTADVELSVEVQGRDALQVQQKLAQQMQPVIEILQQHKVDKLQTGTMNISPEYSKDNASIVVGFVGSNSITFSASLQKAGPLIDSAFKAGANRLQNLSQRPDESTSTVAKNKALQAASKDALEQAKTVLSSLGLKRKQISKVTVAPFGGGIFYAPRAMHFETREPAPTQVLPQQQETTATVTLEIEYE